MTDMHIPAYNRNMDQQDLPDPRVTEVIRKWYGLLKFPKVFDREFEKALASIPISDAITIDTYDLDHPDGKRNLLSFLYMCEALEQTYLRMGISRDILLDTLRDIVRWTMNWSSIKGELCLFELSWLARHLKAQLFQVGRLQFCLAAAEKDLPDYGIRRGDNIVELHIHQDGRLSPEEVEDSLTRGRQFLAAHFPDYFFSCFTCHSWLLDDKLKEYLPASSNIIRFGDRFHKVSSEDSNALLRYLFRQDAYEGNLSQMVCCTDFQSAVKKAVMKGETFHEVLGVIPR